MDVRKYTPVEDVAIFVDDTMDREMAKRVSSSPSAVAVLSPQRYDDITAAASPKRLSRVFASDRTNEQSIAQKLFKEHLANSASKHSSASRSPVMRGDDTSPPTAHVSLDEYNAMVRERDRYVAMYEYQKTMADAYQEKHDEVYKKYQEKIHEVIALSSRNEESKRFIRQLKREMQDCKTRTLNLHNERLQCTADQISEERLQELISRKFSKILQQQEVTFADKEEELMDRLSAYQKVVEELTEAAIVGHEGTEEQRLAHLSSDCINDVLVQSFYRNERLSHQLSRMKKEFQTLLEEKIRSEKDVDLLKRNMRDTDINKLRELKRNQSTIDNCQEEIKTLQDTVFQLRRQLHFYQEQVGAADHSTNMRSPSEEEEELLEDA